MKKLTGVLLFSALALTGCGGNAMESAYDTCAAEHKQRQDDGEDAQGGNVISLEDDGETVLIAGDGNFIGAALNAFDCMAEETDAPASLDQKVSSTSGMDGRQSDTYGDVEVSWTYSATDSGSFEAAFEKN